MQSERVVEAHEGEGAAPSAVTNAKFLIKFIDFFEKLWYNINIKVEKLLYFIWQKCWAQPIFIRLVRVVRSYLLPPTSDFKTQSTKNVLPNRIRYRKIAVTVFQYAESSVIGQHGRLWLFQSWFNSKPRNQRGHGVTVAGRRVHACKNDESFGK